jgi:hypothetical protein
MLRAQRPFTDLQRPLIEGLGLCVLAFGFVEPRQAVDYGAHIRMFRTEGFLKNLERPFIKGLGLRVFALGLIKLCQVEFLAFVHPGNPRPRLPGRKFRFTWGGISRSFAFLPVAFLRHDLREARSLLAPSPQKEMVCWQEYSSIDPEMTNPYRYPEVGHIFQSCRVCGRPFRVCKSRLLRRGGKFCSRQCYYQAWHEFSEALDADRLHFKRELKRVPAELPG